MKVDLFHVGHAASEPRHTDRGKQHEAMPEVNASRTGVGAITEGRQGGGERTTDIGYLEYLTGKDHQRSHVCIKSCISQKPIFALPIVGNRP